MFTLSHYYILGEEFLYPSLLPFEINGSTFPIYLHGSRGNRAHKFHSSGFKEGNGRWFKFLNLSNPTNVILSPGSWTPVQSGVSLLSRGRLLLSRPNLILHKTVIIQQKKILAKMSLEIEKAFKIIMEDGALRAAENLHQCLAFHSPQ